MGELAFVGVRVGAGGLRRATGGRKRAMVCRKHEISSPSPLLLLLLGLPGLV